MYTEYSVVSRPTSRLYHTAQYGSAGAFCRCELVVVLGGSQRVSHQLDKAIVGTINHFHIFQHFRPSPLSQVTGLVLLSSPIIFLLAKIREKGENILFRCQLFIYNLSQLHAACTLEAYNMLFTWYISVVPASLPAGFARDYHQTIINGHVRNTEIILQP